MTAFPANNPPRGFEARRLWILEEAEAFFIPAWATRRWRSLYAPKTLDEGKVRLREAG